MKTFVVGTVASGLGKLLSLQGEPMTMDEIQAEVDAVRADRAARENCR